MCNSIIVEYCRIERIVLCAYTFIRKTEGANRGGVVVHVQNPSYLMGRLLLMEKAGLCIDGVNEKKNDAFEV